MYKSYKNTKKEGESQKLDVLVDDAIDTSKFTKNQLKFRRGTRLEPDVYCDFNCDYSLNVACVDSDQRYYLKPPRNLHSACGNLKMKSLPIKNIPRYICKGRKMRGNKKLCIIIADRYSVVLSLDSVLDAYNYVQSLCHSCLYPAYNCTCRTFDDEPCFTWVITNTVDIVTGKH